MGAIEIICGIILLVVAVVIVVSVVFQESSKGGINALSGGDSSNSFFDKNRGKTKQAVLVRATTISGILLVAVVFVLLALTK